MNITLDAFIEDLIKIRDRSGLGDKEIHFATMTKKDEKENGYSLSLGYRKMLLICEFKSNLNEEDFSKGEPYIILSGSKIGYFDVQIDDPKKPMKVALSERPGFLSARAEGG